LLAATALVALGCLALLKSTPLLAAAMMGAVALTLVAAVVLTLYRSGDRRAFWAGFAIFGWSYLLICYGPVFTENYSPFGSGRMVTARLATALYDRIHVTTRLQQPTMQNATTAVAGDPFAAPPASPPPAAPIMVQVATGPDRVDFLNVAHSLWAALIACGGGCFAAWASRGRRSEVHT
jgi:hypothetical protein